MRSQSGIGGQLLHGPADGKVERGHHKPGGGERSDPGNGLESGGRCCPCWIESERRIQFGLHLADLLGQRLDQLLHACAYRNNHCRTVGQGMELIADLLTHLDQALTFDETLIQFGEHRRRGIPHGWLKQSRQLGKGLSINGVSLGLLEQRFGKVVGLSRIDHTDLEAGLCQGQG